MKKKQPHYTYVIVQLILLTLSALSSVVFGLLGEWTQLLICSAVSLVLGISACLWMIIPFVRSKRQLAQSGMLEYVQQFGGIPDLDAFFSGAWAKQLIQIEQQLKKEYNQQDVINQIKFKALQDQINPHFLYNTLDSIRGLAYLEDAEQTAEMTEALSAYCRYNISGVSDIVTIEMELTNLEYYLLIQKYRFGDRFQVDIHCDKADMEIMQYKIPKLTLQPLVENALFHGLEKRITGGILTIDVETTPKRLYVRVSDNGAGMTAEQVELVNRRLVSGQGKEDIPSTGKHRTGIALTNINNRIKYMFGDDFGLFFSSVLGEGTEVELALPFPERKETGDER